LPYFVLKKDRKAWILFVEDNPSLFVFNFWPSTVPLENEGGWWFLVSRGVLFPAGLAGLLSGWLAGNGWRAG